MVLLACLAGCPGHIEDPTLLGGALGMAGSDGSAAPPCVPSGATFDAGSIPPTFATVKLVLGGGGAIAPCASAPCHAVGGMAPPDNPLTLQDTPELYANMLSYVSNECGHMKLVDPGNPAQSALIMSLTGPCGVSPRMPYGCSDVACIPPDYIAALEQWIANCAPEQ